MFREGDDEDFEYLENPPPAQVQQNQVQIILKTRYKSY